MPARNGIGAGGEDFVDALHHGVRRQAAVLLGQVHRTARRVEAHADGLGCTDFGAEQVAALTREDVVVVGRRRAAGQRECRQAAERRRVHRLLVDTRPDRVQRRQPLEERVIGGEATGDPLIEVVMGVHEPGREHAAGAVDAENVVRQRHRRGVRLDDRCDRGALDEYRRARQFPTIRVDCHHGGILDEGC